MAIRVHHGVSPAAVAGAGFGGGQGRSRAAAMRGGAAANAREQAQIRSLDAAAKQAQLGRDFRTQQAKQAFDYGTQRQQQAFDFQQQSADAALARRYGTDNLDDVRSQGELEYALSTKQRMELDRLAEAEANALASQDFTEDEKKELRYRFAQRRAGIQPVARPRELTPADKFKRNTYTDPRSGRVFSLDENGKIDKTLVEPPEKVATVQDRINLIKSLTPAYTSIDPVTQQPTVDVDAMLKKVNELLTGGGVAQDEPPAGQAGRAVHPAELARQQAERMNAEATAARETAGQPAVNEPGYMERLMQEVEAYTRPVGETPTVQAKANSLETVEARMNSLGASQPNVDAIEVDEMNDLPTADYHLRESRVQLANIRASQEQAREQRARFRESQAGKSKALDDMMERREKEVRARERQTEQDAEARMRKIENRERELRELMKKLEGRRAYFLAQRAAAGGK